MAPPPPPTNRFTTFSYTKLKLKNISEIAAAALLLFLLATNLYRASTQSITVDEAMTYNHFIANGSEAMRAAGPFNNNLGTWLSAVSVHIFGPSELTMRLPSILASALIFLHALQIVRIALH